MDFTIDDGQFRSRIVSHEATGEVGHICEQKDRNLIFERNKRLRQNPGALRDLSFGRWVASIPFEDWDYFLKLNPGYRQMDKDQRQAAIMNFLRADPIGQACQVQDTQYKSATKYHEVKKHGG